MHTLMTKSWPEILINKNRFFLDLAEQEGRGKTTVKSPSWWCPPLILVAGVSGADVTSFVIRMAVVLCINILLLLDIIRRRWKPVFVKHTHKTKRRKFTFSNNNNTILGKINFKHIAQLTKTTKQHQLWFRTRTETERQVW